MKKVYKRISKRMYPPIPCKHCGEEFIPHDKRQEFCHPQHKSDYNNDKRRITNAPFKELNARLKINEAILKKIHTRISEEKLNDSFHISLLQYERFDFTIFHERGENPGTKNEINWFFFYGLEAMNAEHKTFIVRKRK